MATQFVSYARTVRVTVPAGQSVQKDTLVEIAGFFGRALGDAAEGQDVILEIAPAVYSTTQINAADAFNAGDPVYWDAANKVLTTSDGAGANRKVGRVTRAKDASGVVEFVLTGGVA